MFRPEANVNLFVAGPVASHYSRYRLANGWVIYLVAPRRGWSVPGRSISKIKNLGQAGYSLKVGFNKYTKLRLLHYFACQ